MTRNAELDINDDHPLALELTSLRAAISRYQHEAYISSVKLQRHSLDTSHALERTHVLERENALLREELTVLRSHHDTSPHPASLQINELTLSLRRLSDKFTYTEDILLARTTELANALGGLARARHDVEAAYELAASARAREEESKLRERELEKRVRAAEEERRMTDLVVQEYADLVRSIEGRSHPVELSHSGNDEPNGFATTTASNSSVTLVDTLSEGRSGLQKLLEEFNAETERLETEIGRLHGEMGVLQAKLHVERKGSEQDRANLAAAHFALEKLQADDNAAAKVVSRYMKFSQSATDTLQTALSNLKTRHAATMSSLGFEMESLRKAVAFEKRESERLRSALDELSEDISRETYGRRREVSLRLALLTREESVAEGLRRWSRKAHELIERTASSEPAEIHAAFEEMTHSAAALVSSIDGSFSLEENAPGSVARILAAQDAVSTLVHELQVETEKRLAAERRSSREPAQKSPLPPPPPPKSSHSRSLSVATNTIDHLAYSPISEETPSTTPTFAMSSSKVVVNADATTIIAKTTEEASPSPSSSDPRLVTGETAESSFNVVPSPSSPSDRQSELSPMLPSPQASDRLQGFTDSKVDAKDKSSALFPVESSAIAFPSPKATGDETVLLPTQSPSPAPGTVAEEMCSVKPASTESSADQYPMLAELLKIKDRYDDLQRAFRECHLALKELKSFLPSAAAVAPLASSSSLPVLQTALERLDDYNEDTRVELEIRVADEERIMRGYETLLSVPGAIADQEERNVVENDIRKFLDGANGTTAKARDQFGKKLEDLQHDIAVIKRAAHELEFEENPESSAKKSPTWSSWTSGLLGSASSTHSSGPVPTFGSVMTTPRLRHSPSYTQMQAHASSPDLLITDPFASLGLRISMPSHLNFLGTPSTQTGAGTPPTRPRALSGFGGPPVRPRKLSGFYTIGLGSRSSPMMPPAGGQASRKSSVHQFDRDVIEDNMTLTDQEVETETEAGDSDVESDVE